MRIFILRDSGLVFERLDDGSSILFDPAGDATHALNPAATRVWEALVAGGDEGRIRGVLASSLGCDIGDAGVYNTLFQFREAGLIRTDEETRLGDHPSRRDTLRRLSLGFATAMAFPLIETLTGSQQRAYAQAAGSPGPPTTSSAATTMAATSTAPPTTTIAATTTVPATTTVAATTTPAATTTASGTD
jgi:hypothetical protein